VAKVKITEAKLANKISCVKTPRRDEIEFREYLLHFRFRILLTFPV